MVNEIGLTSLYSFTFFGLFFSLMAINCPTLIPNDNWGFSVFNCVSVTLNFLVMEYMVSPLITLCV